VHECDVIDGFDNDVCNDDLVPPFPLPVFLSVGVCGRIILVFGLGFKLPRCAAPHALLLRDTAMPPFCNTTSRSLRLLMPVLHRCGNQNGMHLDVGFR